MNHNDSPVLSRQRRWQIAKAAAGCCQRCGKTREHPDLKTLCLACLEKTRNTHTRTISDRKTYECLSRRVRHELNNKQHITA